MVVVAHRQPEALEFFVGPPRDEIESLEGGLLTHLTDNRTSCVLTRLESNCVFSCGTRGKGQVDLSDNHPQRDGNRRKRGAKRGEIVITATMVQ